MKGRNLLLRRTDYINTTILRKAQNWLRALKKEPLPGKRWDVALGSTSIKVFDIKVSTREDSIHIDETTGKREQRFWATLTRDLHQEQL